MVDWILALILAHLLSDFVFQTDRMVKSKTGTSDSDSTRAHLIHSAIVFGYSFLLLSMVAGLSAKVVAGTFLLAIAHLGIDIIKSFCSRSKRFGELFLFSTDQLLHIASIIGISWAFNLVDGTLQIELLYSWFMQEIDLIIVLDHKQKLLVTVIALIVLFPSANIFIRTILKPFRKQFDDNGGDDDNSDKQLRNAGRYIGSLERIIIVLLTLVGFYEGLIGLYAVKTAIRYNRFSQPRFAEYYFLGTTLSFIIGITVAIVFKALVY